MEIIKKTLPVALGVVIGGLLIWGVVTFVKDHKALKEVVSFLNAQIQLSQQRTVQPEPVAESVE